MTSRFFQASDSSSEESSEEELYSEEEESEEEESEEESGEESDEDESSGSEIGAARFLRDAETESESDEEDGAKVLKSAKDKRFEELEATVRSIENAEKINDWAVIQDRECPSIFASNPLLTRLRRLLESDSLMLTSMQSSISSTARYPR